MKNTQKRKTVFTVKSSISLASKWRKQKRGATNFAETYPEAFSKIMYAATRKNALTSDEEFRTAEWLVNNA